MGGWKVSTMEIGVWKKSMKSTLRSTIEIVFSNN